MNLTIFAASGGIGRHIFDQAIASGHHVTAVVRNPAKLGRLPGCVRIVTADLASPDAAVLSSAVEGADAVLSGLGPHSNADAGIAEPGTRAIVQAMRQAGARRLLVVSAAPVSTIPSPARPNPPRHDPGDSFLMRHVGAPFARTILGAVFADLARMEDVVRASELDWTIFRPPQLRDTPLGRRYRTAVGQNVRGGSSIGRADVAHAMLAALDDPGTVHQIIGIAY